MNNHNDDNLWVSLSDLLYICKRAKKKIITCAIVGSILTGLYALTRPIEYTSTATFREKASTQNGAAAIASGSLTSMFLGTGRSSSYSEAISTMKSRSLIGKLVKELGLQGNLSKKEAHWPMFSSIKNNLKIEYANLKKQRGPIFSDNKQLVSVKNISYDGESPTGMRIIFLSEDSFEVFSSRKAQPIPGTIGVPVTTDNATFTIVRKNSDPIAFQEYVFTIEPFNSTVDMLITKISIDIDKDDKTLLKLQYSSADRHYAVEILNNLMRLYQDYLKLEQDRVSNEQIAYLATRQDEMKDRLRIMMNEHASILTSDALSLGFPDVSSAMNFFANAQQQCSRDLLALDLELKHLQHVQRGSVIYLVNSSSHDSSTGLSSLITRMRDLKHQADSIELALGESWEGTHNVSEELVNKQFEELAEVQSLSGEVNEIVADLEKGQSPNQTLKLFKDPRYKVKMWCEKLIASEGNKQLWKTSNNHFLTYLSNLKHVFHIHEKAVQEQLTHQRNPQRELLGIDLTTAKDLFLDYSKRLSSLENEEAQKSFLIVQMKEPAFEVSSLSAVLNDPVSARMIAEASNLLLKLKDGSNQSSKEQERLRHDLAVQKGFLSEYLNQTVQLLKLSQKLVLEKIQSLQVVTLGLIQQEISVLEKHFADYVALRIDQLTQQKGVIEQHQSELQQEMASLPNKWVSEKLIDQQMELNALMVEEVTKMVESKNTSSNLDMIQSAPVDMAIASTQPKAPRTPLFILFGAALGSVLMVSYVLVSTISKGIPVTADNLKLAHQNVSGTISKLYQKDPIKLLPDEDLETLRHLMIFLESSRNTEKQGFGSCVALLLGQDGPDYSQDLAMLMSKKGLKVAILPLFFDRPAQEQELPGLLQYLEGKISEPKVIKESGYDVIKPGGISRFAHEFLSSSRFHHLIMELRQKYDWVFVLTRASANSSETKNLLHLCHEAVITITDQRWDDIKTCMQVSAQSSPPKNFSFIIASENIS